MSLFNDRMSIVWILIAYAGTPFLSEVDGQTTSRAARSASKSRDAIDRYAQGLMKHYDKDLDGFIDHEEAQEMRQRPGGETDLNGDGRFSLQEVKQWTADRTQRAKEKIPRAKKESVPSQISVKLQVELIEISDTSSTEEFETLAKILNLNHANSSGIIESIKALDGVAGIDTLSCNVLPARKHVFHSGRRTVPASSRSRSNSITHDTIEVTPVINGSNIEISLSLAKSSQDSASKKSDHAKKEAGSAAGGAIASGAVLQNGMLNLSGQDAAKTEKIVQQLMQSRSSRTTSSRSSKSPSEVSNDLSLETSIVCQNGCANATFLSQSNRNWLLIVQATHD